MDGWIDRYDNSGKSGKLEDEKEKEIYIVEDRKLSVKTKSY